MSSAESRDALAANPAPAAAAQHGVTLERYAAICAHIAEADRTLPEVLAAAEIDAARWREACDDYTKRLAADAMDGDGMLSEAYATAFAKAQDTYKPVPEMTPEEWAELTVALSGPSGTEALAARGLSHADHLRLSRAWARRLATERATAKRFHEAFFKFSARSR